MAGILYVCPTPIGNLKDITLRVLETLKEADMIAAEDTRTTQKLLNHFEIKTPIISYHKHNERTRSDFIVERLLDGKNIALVSDAGTPGISDPGQIVIKGALEAGIEVVSLPGPSACLAALVVSGFCTDRFAFEGFLPRKEKERRQILDALAGDPRTLIFYEAPHRIMETLGDLLEVLGDRKIAIVRELTKKFEEIVRGNLSQINAEFNEGYEPRGEYVLVVEGSTAHEANLQQNKWRYLSLEEHVAFALSEGISKKEAIRAVAELRGLPRREVYAYVEALKSKK